MISRRIAEEVEILKRECASGPDIVRVGVAEIQGKSYVGVRIARVRLNHHKFKQSFGTFLFLLPPEYPKLPSLGVYLDRPYPDVAQRDRHLTLRAHYGTPSMEGQGWYWYCYGLGGFDKASWRRCWRPGSRADNGHNLATLFAAARQAVNS